jgi:hypothetical protein
MGGCPETKEERRDTESSPALIRIASAYRSVSTEALQVLTGVLPVDIQAEGRALLRRQCISRDQLKERQLQEWQTRWETTGKGSWTRQLLPRIAEWTGRNHGELEYYTGCPFSKSNMGNYNNIVHSVYRHYAIIFIHHTLKN